MKDEGYGPGYAYDHDPEDGFSGQDYFPRNDANAGCITYRLSVARSVS